MPLFYIDTHDHHHKEPEIHSLEPDRKGVGYIDTPMDYKWTNRTLKLTKKMCIYITSDGLVDQIGGTKKIAFGKKRFVALLKDNYHKPMTEQQTLLTQAFYDYQGKQKRRDDLCLMGFRY